MSSIFILYMRKGKEMMWHQNIQQIWFALESGREAEEIWKLRFLSPPTPPGSFPVEPALTQSKLHSKEFPLWVCFSHERGLFTFNPTFRNFDLPEFLLPYMVFGVCVRVSRNSYFFSFSSSWIKLLCTCIKIFEKRVILLPVNRVTSWHFKLLHIKFNEKLKKLNNQ